MKIEIDLNEGLPEFHIDFLLDVLLKKKENLVKTATTLEEVRKDFKEIREILKRNKGVDRNAI